MESETYPEETARVKVRKRFLLANYASTRIAVPCNTLRMRTVVARALVRKSLAFLEGHSKDINFVGYFVCEILHVSLEVL